jgi:hypothetical protein
MLNTENVNEQDMEGNLPEQQLADEQATAIEQLLRLQSDIEGQVLSVVMAINPLAEALDNDGNVSCEMMNHIKAQILKAHMQLDDLEQLLDSLDWPFTTKEE